MAWKGNRIWGGRVSSESWPAQLSEKRSPSNGGQRGPNWWWGGIISGWSYNPPLFAFPLHVLVPGPPKDAPGDPGGEEARGVWALGPERWEPRIASMLPANLLSVGSLPLAPGTFTKELLFHRLPLSQKAQTITLDSLHLCYDPGFWWAQKESQDLGFFGIKFPVCGWVPVPTASGLCSLSSRQHPNHFF